MATICKISCPSDFWDMRIAIVCRTFTNQNEFKSCCYKGNITI